MEAFDIRLVGDGFGVEEFPHQFFMRLIGRRLFDASARQDLIKKGMFVFEIRILVFQVFLGGLQEITSIYDMDHYTRFSKKSQCFIFFFFKTNRCAFVQNDV